jgi:hypothetical protein
MIAAIKCYFCKIGKHEVIPNCRYITKVSQKCSVSDEIVPDTVDLMPENFKSEFLTTLKERGYLNQCTDYKGLDEQFEKGPIAAYIGFDATAQSLHVGSLLQIMILRNLQKHGHKPIILMGGGTTKVGDPTGKHVTQCIIDN